MSELFDNYPLAKKTYEEQVDIAATFGMLPPPGVEEFLARNVQIIEDYVGGSAADKDNVAVACVLNLAAPYMLVDTSRFATYPDAVKEVVNLLVFDDPVACEKNAILVQSGIVQSAAGMEIAIERFQRGVLPPGLTVAQLKEDTAQDSPEVPAVVVETAPRLAAFFEKTITDCKAAVAALPDDPSPVVPKKSSRRPRP